MAFDIDGEMDLAWSDDEIASYTAEDDDDTTWAGRLSAYERDELERPDPCDDLYVSDYSQDGVISVGAHPQIILGCDRYVTDGPLQAKMHALGVTHILDCRSEGEIYRPYRPAAIVDPRILFEWHANMTDDDFTKKTTSYFRAALDWAAPVLNDGGVIYVHCAMGINRGPSNAYALLRGIFDMSTVEALTAIRTARPFAAVAYWRDADDAIREIYGQ